MDPRTKELIAVGAAVSANCQPCLEYHTAKAQEFGANKAEIATAIAVGKAVRKGAAAKMDKFAESAMTALAGPGPAPAAGKTDSECCCGDGQES